MASDKRVASDGASEALLTLRQAAELCGLTKGELLRRVARGDVVAPLVGSRNPKRRFARQELIAAGLLPAPRSDGDPIGDLITLIREQNERLSVIEDDRARLAGQLGMALERIRSLEERLPLSERVHATVGETIETSSTPRRPIAMLAPGRAGLGLVGAVAFRALTSASTRASGALPSLVVARMPLRRRHPDA